MDWLVFWQKMVIERNNINNLKENLAEQFITITFTITIHADHIYCIICINNVDYILYDIQVKLINYNPSVNQKRAMHPYRDYDKSINSLNTLIGNFGS